MTQTQTPPPASKDEKVRIFHTGKGHGPMHTKHGPLNPGESLEVDAALAEKLTGAYKHVKLAKDVIPGGAADPRLARENAMLKAELEKLQKELEAGKKTIEDGQESDKKKDEAREKVEELLEDANQKLNLAENGDKAALQAAVREFLEAKTAKDLKEVQEKHKDIVA